jgi:hypothetical protein
MKSASQYVLPANAARRLLEIANAMEAPHGFIEVGQLNRTFLNEGGSPDEYRAGVAKLRPTASSTCIRPAPGSPLPTQALRGSRNYSSATVWNQRRRRVFSDQEDSNGKKSSSMEASGLADRQEGPAKIQSEI